jgi:hypothetical protein
MLKETENGASFFLKCARKCNRKRVSVKKRKMFSAEELAVVK